MIRSDQNKLKNLFFFLKIHPDLTRFSDEREIMQHYYLIWV